jgi:hypothetical protein
MLKRAGIVLAAVAGLAVAAPAHAAYINGSIGLNGIACPIAFVGSTCNAADWSTTDNVYFTATSPNGFVSAGSQTGDYSSVPNFLGVDFQSFQFDPLTPNPVAPLWTFTYLGITYSFDLANVSIVSQTSGGVHLSGTGTAHITGFQDTLGTWDFSTSHTGAAWTFSQTNSASGQAVPEPASITMLGSGLLALGAAVRRRLKARV